jgi:cysteine desulfurase
VIARGHLDGRIYLDFAATCPLDPAVKKVMDPWWECGNAASSHEAGIRSREANTRSRATVAKWLGAQPREIIFTSGATEADNLALKGYADAAEHAHLVTVATEHKAILKSAEYLDRWGIPVEILGVDSSGMIDLDELDRRLRPGSLCSVMAVNNETGVIAPINEISRICRANDALLHVDAAQAMGRIPLSTRGIDMLSISAHKLYGPKGIGALYVREGVPLEPQIHGGRQEHAMRAGTSPTPLIVGFSKALDIACSSLHATDAHIRRLRSILVDHVQATCPRASISCPGARRVPGIVSLEFPGLDGQALLQRVCERVCCSTGSACSADGPSHVLAALGIHHAVLRISLGRTSTPREVAAAARQITASVAALRKREPLPRLAYLPT